MKKSNSTKYLIYRSEYEDNSDKQFIGETEIPRYEYPLYCEKTNLDSILAYYNENNSWFYEDTLITNNTELLIDINNHITYYYSSEYVGYKYLPYKNYTRIHAIMGAYLKNYRRFSYELYPYQRADQHWPPQTRRQDHHAAAGHEKVR